MDRKTLLLANTTGYQARSFAEAARAAGIPLVLGTDRCDRLEDPWRDGAIALHFESPERAAAEVAERYGESGLSGVVAVGDKPTVTAAHIAERLGLPWHTVAGARACHDKFEGRRRLAAAGLLAPEFGCYPVAGGVDAALAAAGFPCVLKPVGLSGSRGVIRADGAAAFRAAFERIAALLSMPELRARKEDGTDRIVVEEFIPGREFAVEAVMHRGEPRVLALFDKPDPLDGPFFEETIYVTPSRLPERDQQAITGCLEAAARALGLRHGPIHAEFRLNERGPWLLDIAARPIGGLCSRVLRFDGPAAAATMSLEELLLRNARGERLDGIRRETAAAAVMMIPVPEAGILDRVEGIEEARQAPGIEDVVITAKPRHKLVPWPEGATYPGFIFARAESPEAAEHALREAHRRLRFVMLPSLAVV